MEKIERNKKLSFILLINFFIYIQHVESQICTIDNYKIKLHPCEQETQTRNISIYLNSKCILPKNITPDNPIYPYYTLPTYNVSCIDCLQNEKIIYDPNQKDIICQKCPNNTHSTGKDLKIIENWSEEIINQNFIVNCISIGYSSYKENKDCTKLSISHDKTYIESGTLTGDEQKYIIQIIIPFKSENWGKFILSYKKDTKYLGNFNNGVFRIFFDYKLVQFDYDEYPDFINFSYDFSPGHHQFFITYNYYAVYSNYPLKLYIKSLELINIRDSFTECQNDNDFNYNKNIKNELCPVNQYFNKENNTCIKCEENEYSLFGFTSSNECLPKKNCTKFDLSIMDIGKCDPLSKTKKIKYDLISHNYCIFETSNENLFKMEKNIKCEEEILNEEEECKIGYTFSHNYRLILSNIKLNDFFDRNNGWYSNENEIFTGIYNIAGEKKELYKKVKISEYNSYISFDLELNLQKDEEFKIIINSNITHEYNLDNSKNIKYFLNISLNQGDNNIIFSYIKKSQFEPTYINPVLIKNLIIHGSSELYTERKLIPCSFNEISSSDCNECIKCESNLIADKQTNKCITSKEGKLKNCPSYTYEENNKCILNEILYQNNEKIKINLSPLKEYQKYICKELAGNLCYEDYKFIGPIVQYDNNYILRNLDEQESNTNNNKKNNIEDMEIMEYKNPLFFISLFEPNSISLTDYLYSEKGNIFLNNTLKPNEGHIFALFTQTKKSSFLFSDDNLNPKRETNEKNSSFISKKKLKVTISQNIEKIYIISQSLNVRYKSGLLIEFSHGDICLNDNSKLFKAYIYLKCSKYQISFPRLIETLDNGCTYLFQWDTPYACKNCLTKEIDYYEVTKCKNGLRNYIFSSNEECVIFNGSDINLKGYNNQFNDDTIKFENDLLQKLFFGKNVKRKLNEKEQDKNNKVINIKNEKQLKKFKFDFIEKEIYQEKCYFYEDFSLRVKIIIIIICCVYLLAIILTIIYCCKYNSIKHKYQKIKNRSKIKNVNIRNQNET